MTEPAHILVVDDDPNVCRMLHLILSDNNYRVSTTNSGEEALAFLDLVNPDLILMDMFMPGINGHEVIQRIKSDPSRPFIPIILVTAHSDQNSKVSGLDSGADDFLVKPVEFAELLARVRAMLRLQRSQRSLQAEQRKTELLLHLTRELGTTLDLDELLTHFLSKLADAVGALRASIILTNEAQPRFYSSSSNRPTLPLEDIVRDGVVGWVLRENRPLIIDDTSTDSRWLGTNVFHRSVHSVAGVPITREGQSLGAITLVHHTRGYFTDEHLSLLDSVAAQCAIALENAELFRLTRSQKELLERRAEELERINQVSQYLTELMRPEQLLRLVAHLVHHTFGYPIVSILLHDNEDLVVRAAAGVFVSEGRLGTRIPYGQGVVGWAATHQEPIYVPDVQRDPRYIELNDDDWTRSELAVPILTAREVFGVLAVMSNIEDAFGPNDRRLLSTLASQLGVALDNARLFDTEKRRVRQLGQVNNLSVAITAQLDLTKNLRIAANAVCTIFGIQRCGIVVAGEEQRRGIWVSSGQMDIMTAQTEFYEILESQQVESLLDLRAPQLVIDVNADQRFKPLMSILTDAGVTSLALAPLMSQGERIGTLALDISNQVEQFGQAELALLETIASLIAQVMENARLYRQVVDERSTLNTVLEGAADPILLISPNEQLLLANRAAIQQLGLSNSAGQPINTLITHPDLLHALSGAQNGHRDTTPNEITLPDDKIFSISVAPVKGANNERIGRVAVLQDITAIKELERRERERLRSVLRRYVSPQVVEQVLAGGGDFGTPVERTVAVLITDLRGYTTLTEGIEPRILVERVLNRYFDAMTDIFYRHEGTIDKSLGDGIIGVFGSPLSRADDPQRALTTAVDLQRAFTELRAVWREELGLDIGMGIGISYGSAVVGNIGSSQRLDYTLIGDVVNTASRLNGLARPGEIMVSHQLIEALPLDWHCPWSLRVVGRVDLKGKQQPHLVYEIEYDNAMIIAH